MGIKDNGGHCGQFGKPRNLYEPYLIVDYFVRVLTLELRSQEVIIYDNVDINEKESR